MKGVPEFLWDICWPCQNGCANLSPGSGLGSVNIINISALWPRKCSPTLIKLKLSFPNINKTRMSAFIYKEYNDQADWEIFLAS